MLLEALVAHVLHVLLQHDPRGTGRRRRVEREEVRPRLLQDEADAVRRGDLDRLDLLLEELGGGAAIPLEAELDVVGRHRLAVVKHGALAQHELVPEAVGTLGPRLREAR